MTELKHNYSTSAMKCLGKILLIKLKPSLHHTPQPCKQRRDSRSEAFPNPSHKQWKLSFLIALSVQNIYRFNGYNWYWHGNFLSYSQSYSIYKLSALRDTNSNFYQMEINFCLMCQHQIFCECSWMMWHFQKRFRNCAMISLPHFRKG